MIDSTIILINDEDIILRGNVYNSVGHVSVMKGFVNDYFPYTKLCDSINECQENENFKAAILLCQFGYAVYINQTYRYNIGGYFIVPKNPSIAMQENILRVFKDLRKNNHQVEVFTYDKDIEKIPDTSSDIVVNINNWFLQNKNDHKNFD